jgi:type 1 glutamine amidotransferase
MIRDYSLVVSRNGSHAEPQSLLREIVGPSELCLRRSMDHRRNFLNGVKSRTTPLSNIDEAYYADAVRHLGDDSMRLGHKLKGDVRPKKARKVLLAHIRKRNGKPVNEHGSILWANYRLSLTGQKTGGFEWTISNDESAFTPENLKQYDAVILNNTLGMLFDDPVLRQVFLDFVKSGKGSVGFHAAAATFVQYPVYDQFPEYGVLDGYEDRGHPWALRDTIYGKIDGPRGPVRAMFKGPFREPTLWDRLHCLLSIDVSKMEIGPLHNILKRRQQDLDFPIFCVKQYGNGRVFYTSIGHSAKAFADSMLMPLFFAEASSRCVSI